MRNLPSAHRVAALLGLAAVGLSACGVGGSNRSQAAAASPMTQMPAAAMPASGAAPASAAVLTDAVTIQTFAFTPAAISVKAGTTVVWTNKDDEAHTVFFAFDHSISPVLVNGHNVYSKTFTTPGSYSYHCTIHPFMVGTVVVSA